VETAISNWENAPYSSRSSHDDWVNTFVHTALSVFNNQDQPTHLSHDPLCPVRLDPQDRLRALVDSLRSSSA
jgi:hypothetical protein